MKKYEKTAPFPRTISRLACSIWIHARSCPDLPGLARLGVDRDLGSKLYLPHAPTSQSATRPLGRQLAYRITTQTLAGSHHIACKLHAITKDYHPPGRHQNRIFQLLQPFRAKTSIFMKNATFTRYPPDRLDPYSLGSPGSMEIEGNLLWGHLRASELIQVGRRGRPRRS